MPRGCKGTGVKFPCSFLVFQCIMSDTKVVPLTLPYIRCEMAPTSRNKNASAFLNLENKKVERKNDQEKSKLGGSSLNLCGEMTGK